MSAAMEIRTLAPQYAFKAEDGQRYMVYYPFEVAVGTVDGVTPGSLVHIVVQDRAPQGLGDVFGSGVTIDAAIENLLQKILNAERYREWVGRHLDIWGREIF